MVITHDSSHCNVAVCRARKKCSGPFIQCVASPCWHRLFFFLQLGVANTMSVGLHKLDEVEPAREITILHFNDVYEIEAGKPPRGAPEGEAYVCSTIMSSTSPDSHIQKRSQPWSIVAASLLRFICARVCARAHAWCANTVYSVGVVMWWCLVVSVCGSDSYVCGGASRFTQKMKELKDRTNGSVIFSGDAFNPSMSVMLQLH